MTSTEALNEVLKLTPGEIDRKWAEIDALVMRLPRDDQIKIWAKFLGHVNDAPISKGHPFFRLGVLHLLADSDETVAISYLEKAFREDQTYARDHGQIAHRMGTYRLLALCKGFFEYLANVKPTDWQVAQLKEPNRNVVVQTVLMLYDQSLVHPVEMQTYTYQTFFALVADRKLCAFAIENYFCAEELIEKASLKSGWSLLHQHEYPFARAIVGLIGGVLEAILADRLPHARGQSLGVLIRGGNEAGIIVPGTRIAALASLMLYQRNHIHADRASGLTHYYIDLHVANGCKVALDWAISEMSGSGGTPPAVFTAPSLTAPRSQALQPSSRHARPR